MNAIVALLRADWQLARRNRQLLVLFLLFPLIGLALPSLLLLAASELAGQAVRGEHLLLGPLYSMLQGMAEVIDLDLADTARVLVLRMSASWYVLMPCMMVPVSAAFAVVGDRQRGTLEVLLATPLGDLQFCLAKLASSLLPALAATWLAAAGGSAIAAAVVASQHGSWLWPDAPWLLAVLLLTPLLAMAVTLACLWISVRATDAQAASQATSLVLMPLLLVVLVLVGPAHLLEPAAILVAAGMLLLLDLLLLALVLRRYRRSGLLGR